MMMMMMMMMKQICNRVSNRPYAIKHIVSTRGCLSLSHSIISWLLLLTFLAERLPLVSSRHDSRLRANGVC